MAKTSKQLSKGGARDISMGPISKRSCTDVLFFLLFLGHIVVYLAICTMAFYNGDPERLFSGQDYQGNLCGYPGQVNDQGANLQNNSLLYYSMNMTTALDETVGSYFSTTGAFDPEAVNASVTPILDPYAFWDTYANDLINSLSTYFVPVCVSSCEYNVTNSSEYRTYVWEGPGDPDMQANWDAYLQAAETEPSLMDPFTFMALPLSVCPYPAKDCVPLQYAEFASLLDNYCVPKVTDLAQSYVPSGWMSTAEVGFGDMISDLKTAWPVIVIMAFVGLFISMLFLGVLRLCVGVFIWLTVLTGFLLVLASAIGALLYAQKCIGQSIFEAAQAINSTDSAMDVFEGQSLCPNGYSIPDSSGRTSVRIIGYVLFGVAAVFLFLVLIFRKRIRLGIAINKVASQFVRQNKSTVTVPVLQSLWIIGWWGLWLAAAVYTITVIPAGYRNMTDQWVGNYTEATVQCHTESGVYIKDYIDHVPVYACKEVKYLLNWQFWFSIFSLFWVNSFILSTGQMIIAGAVGVWYFTPNHSKGSLGTYPIRTGFRYTFIFHLGTVALGALILAIVRFVRLLFFWEAYLHKQATNKNKFVKWIVACIYGVLTLIDKIISFLNKNAFIQTALFGTSFFTSCGNALSLVVRNAGRIGALAVIGGLIHFIGIAFITAATGFAGWAVLVHYYDGQLHSPIVPTVVFIVMGYCIGSIVISVFAISVDSILQCFVADEELHRSEGGAKFTPQLLQKFLAGQDGKDAGYQQPQVVGVEGQAAAGQPISIVNSA